MIAAALLALGASFAQEQPDHKIAQLIDSLKSDDIDERSRASEKLHAAGRAAFSALFKASRDVDLEVSDRAQEIIRSFPGPQLYAFRQNQVREDTLTGRLELASFCVEIHFPSQAVLDFEAALELLEKDRNNYPYMRTQHRN